MDYQFKPGDRVKLSRAGVIYYGGAWPAWVPQEQGGGSTGTVVFAGDRPHKPGAAPRPYFVRWDSGVENAYRVEDLERAAEPANLEEHGPGQDAPNVIRFIPR